MRGDRDGRRLRRLARAIAAEQPLPPVALDLVALEGDSEQVSRLVAVIESDPALDDRLASVAMAVYRASRPEAWPDGARLDPAGYHRLRGAALMLCLLGATSGDAHHLDARRFWRHTAAVAYVMPMLAWVEGGAAARATPVGLCHNVGRLFLAQRLPGEYSDALLEAGTGGRALASVQRRRTGFSDCELGAAVVRAWGLPGWLSDAIGAQDSETRPVRFAARASAAAEFAERLARARSLVAWCGIGDGAVTDWPERGAIPDDRALEAALHFLGGPEGVRREAGRAVDLLLDPPRASGM